MGASNFSYAVTLTVRSVPVMVPVVYGCSLTFVLSCYIAVMSHDSCHICVESVPDAEMAMRDADGCICKAIIKALACLWRGILCSVLCAPCTATAVCTPTYSRTRYHARYAYGALSSVKSHIARTYTRRPRHPLSLTSVIPLVRAIPCPHPYSCSLARLSFRPFGGASANQVP